MAVPFSRFREADGLVFAAGQIHINEKLELVGETTEEKVHQCMKNVEKILSEAGLELSDVVNTTIYLTDMSDYPALNEVYGTYFSAPYPARTAVCVKELPLGASIEIAVVAAKKS
ncbi:hypothetical protein A2886_00385 [candidate division WWE3 bacterium RIFCSPHIGHO2_01_FULL_42_13]|uniref:Reactive intermediate/imine deaminase n=1 Tax=candidate division WWE3 bacterium RIFCSPHIGHO2_01_FULL_42_13 TaxID=1802617 RepID=A0A1F4US80_UNCKA|nr:MAG: hypothetical protein A2886_00385 [candidate division WWE3 bacterium RIFCSPHIGHO2_01_FULL_42_13]